MTRKQGTYCSPACLHEAIRLDGPGNRSKRPDGYIHVYFPKHPVAMARPNKMILEHRLVMEEKLGRLLRPGETVNHINHIRDDNRPENLELMSLRDHQRETATWAKEQRRKERAELAEYRRRYGPLT